MILPLNIILFFKDFIYLSEREAAHVHKQAEWQAEAEREAGSLLSRGPDVGLHLRTLET